MLLINHYYQLNRNILGFDSFDGYPLVSGEDLKIVTDHQLVPETFELIWQRLCGSSVKLGCHPHGLIRIYRW